MDARHEEFLRNVAQAMSPTAAARAAGCQLSLLYKRRREDEEFAAKWAEAYESGTHELEDAATQRAMTDSDTLMIFMLKSRDPAKYREARDEKGGVTNVQINFVRDPSAFPMPSVTVSTVPAVEALRQDDPDAILVRKLTNVGNDMLSDVSEAAQGYGTAIDLQEQEQRALRDVTEEVRRHNEEVRSRSKK